MSSCRTWVEIEDGLPDRGVLVMIKGKTGNDKFPNYQMTAYISQHCNDPVFLDACGRPIAGLFQSPTHWRSMCFDTL